MNKRKLKNIAEKLVWKGKGILAADESTPTIKKRLDSISVESTEESRSAYREMLLTSSGIEKYISGVILFDETLRQKTSDNVSFPKLLQDKGIIPGIKVDKGAKDFANFPGEKITEGLDGLRDRFKEYAELGAGFSKWRAVIVTGNKTPTKQAIDANAHALARYAALSQEAGIVPVVEPEVLMTGKHTIERHAEVTRETLKSVFLELKKYEVYLEGMLLKPNMIASGLDASKQVSPKEVAKKTVGIFREVIPEKVPGLVFLSGGLTPEEATTNLNEINCTGKQPWELSYSFGRALQGEALQTWAGKKENVTAAQKAFIQRAESVSKARNGKLNV